MGSKKPTNQKKTAQKKTCADAVSEIWAIITQIAYRYGIRSRKILWIRDILKRELMRGRKARNPQKYVVRKKIAQKKNRHPIQLPSNAVFEILDAIANMARHYEISPRKVRWILELLESLVQKGSMDKELIHRKKENNSETEPAEKNEKIDNTKPVGKKEAKKGKNILKSKSMNGQSENQAEGERKKIHLEKRENGVYYTAGNPFENRAFRDWATLADLPANRILEPFAGANSLIENLMDMNLCEKWESYDINPGADGVIKQDTLLDFPKNFSVCITNPPWLAKNSATRRGLPFPKATVHDDLYKVALEECLTNCKWVAALVPESFIRASLFQDRLSHFISLTEKMFTDTENPVGLALFQPEEVKDVRIWRGNEEIGLLSKFEDERPKKPYDKIPVRFNDPNGNVGLIAIDNHSAPSIRFCKPNELKDYPVRTTCRSITKLMVKGKIRIREWNDWLESFRKNTHDVLLTSFKGIRKDGMYRRRLDWDLARGIINHVQS